MASALMFLGTSSDSGKSVMAAAFCRILKRRGVRVAPFKAQNMALNSGVTSDGLEMGRAQIVQAEAAGIEPHVDMNPILLKPTSERGSQVVLRGVVHGDMDASEYYREKTRFWPVVRESYDRLAGACDVVVLEGAGSPVEVNLKDADIVNMRMADYADAHCILVADIDRGGVFASIVGTAELLTPAERQRFIGVIINKFRGDARLLRDGCEFIFRRTALPVLGVVPMIQGLYIPGEDSVALARKPPLFRGSSAAASVIGVVRLAHIANYTDFDPLECDPRFHLRYIESPAEVAACDAVIIPGSKNVFFDYRRMAAQGMVAALLRYHADGGRIAGICGGYQMLGLSIADPYGVEEAGGNMAGLGLLPVTSIMELNKITTRAVYAAILPGPARPVRVEGYEIHMGRTAVAEPDKVLPLSPPGSPQGLFGVAAPDGRVWGTYVHGLFDSDGLRDVFLDWAAGRDSEDERRFSYREFKEDNYNLLADEVERAVDVKAVLRKVLTGC